MLSYKEALQIITAAISPNAACDKSLTEAAGLYLACDLESLVTLPKYATAFKDGFAVRFAEVARAMPDEAAELKIAGESFAGGARSRAEFAALTACKITTGAYMPLSFDTVIPWEDCLVRDGYVVVTQAPVKHQNVTPAGQEFVTGEMLLRKGTQLKPADIGLAAASGHATLPVARPPRVGLISTGNELALPGTPLKDGQIYSSNQFQLKTQLSNMRMPAEAVIIEDDFSATKQGVLDLIECNDVVISSGGSADSEKDFMQRALWELGWRMLVEKVDIRPGHTVRFGLLSGKPFFILPGTPSGTEICFNIFVTPLLLKMAGAGNLQPNVIYGKLAVNVKGSTKSASVGQVVATFGPKGVEVAPIPKQCGRIKAIAYKNALIIIPKGGFSTGDTTEVFLI